MNLDNKHREDMNIVIVGHVDHGKSTIIGRLLADTNSLPEGKLEQVRETCRKNSKPFEYAFLLDALKAEQAQGITIDSARCFFKTELRDYIIIDAPGHVEFLKNMVTGASRAEVALLVIDANEGIKENSKRHGYLLSMLGIKRIAVVVNKMDLVDYSEEVFNNIVNEYTDFLKKIDISPLTFIPVSGFHGVNIKDKSNETKWYEGESVLSLLDSLETEKNEVEKPFRMSVQDVYKFTRNNDDRRIIAGTIETGKLKVGDEVLFSPSGKTSRVKSIEDLNNTSMESVEAGFSTGFTLDEQIFIKRGELVSLFKETRPLVTNSFRANLFWLGKKALEENKEYFIKIGTAKEKVKLVKVLKVIDASNLNNSTKDSVERHEVAEVILESDREIAFDLANENSKTSRFVIIDDYEIAGGGIVLESNEQVALEELDIYKELSSIKSSIANIHRILERRGA